MKRASRATLDAFERHVYTCLAIYSVIKIICHSLGDCMSSRQMAQLSDETKRKFVYCSVFERPLCY